ncbi:MAG: DUF128 domain-containing protein [Spirochaetes bacterium]|nr:DUF128 domain-containing protein [Spirochaetota bacterium]
MNDKIEKKQLSILKILSESKSPVNSKIITEILNNEGSDVSERTVRFHLLQLDGKELTKNIGRLGRVITDKGLEEIEQARVYEKIGFLTAKIDRMTYKMNFNLETKKGTVVINVSLIEKSKIEESIPLIKKVFDAGYAMGKLVTIIKAGERVGSTIIPEGYIGIGTVCSITINGVFLKYGIPTNSRFGGLLEIKEGKPTRFVAIINYNGTTLDPLEIFIKSGMTRYKEATLSGNGLIGASFREVPAESKAEVLEIAKKLEKIGLGSIMKVGWQGQPLLEIPVNEGHIGVIIIGGLNPVAILEESGIKVASKALSGIIDYERLFNYQLLDKKIADS